ncbi:hypothetical protein, partial [Streptomyces buecherae]|uniref:hypothetical protein n=1 Tax=Streptomyces buecherae TaxID=2763006 RepID=UPI003789C8E4
MWRRISGYPPEFAILIWKGCTTSTSHENGSSTLDVVSFGVLGSLHRVVVVERMVPDELWELFQR